MSKTVIEPELAPQRGRTVPIFNWAGELEEDALRQATNLAALPFAFHHVALMPDAHTGYGMPIGGVLATQGYVVPNALGVDIACGMHARRTNIEAGLLRSAHAGQGTILRAVLNQMQRDIPTGNGPNGSHAQEQPHPAWWWDNLPVSGDSMLDQAQAALKQLGTLGSGNHFIEFQEDEDGLVWVMLHSGSRALGKQVCDYFNKRAVTRNERYFSTVPRAAGLAFLPINSEDGEDYLQWMHFCKLYAEESRRRMLDRTMEILFLFAKGVAPDRDFLVTEAIDTHHNMADMEHHFGTNVLVHRKGAVRARDGEMVIIPGSMETGSYIARGLGNADSFTTCSHGAGRALSRKKAMLARSTEDVVLSLRAKGIELAKHNLKDVAEEAGHAYKNIETVMAASAELVEPVYKLRPMGTLKG